MSTVNAIELEAFAKALLVAGGYAPDHAARAAEVLVWANLRGADSHGVLRIPRYLAMIKAGKIAPKATPEITQKSSATAVLDAKRAPGPSAMSDAMQTGLELAHEFGIGCCVTRDISHAGAVGFYAQQASARNMVGVVMTASGPLMAYHGAAKSALSTNPLSIAVPTGGDPILLDMSTSAVALGKVMHAKEAGSPIPEGWGLDDAGQATQDPHAVATLLPMSGPKGSGLSLMIEILCSVLANNPAIAPALEGTGNAMNGMAIAIDISRFCEPTAFSAHVRHLSGLLHELPKAQGTNTILLPGERGFACARERQANGIPLASGTLSKLSALAAELGVGLPASMGQPA
jgi:ureidoglycolate dehydrogenase (NAD+)